MSTRDANERIVKRSVHPEDFDTDSESELIDEIIEVERSIKRFKTDWENAESKLKKIETVSESSLNLQVNLDAVAGPENTGNVSDDGESNFVSPSRSVGPTRRR